MKEEQIPQPPEIQPGKKNEKLDGNDSGAEQLESENEKYKNRYRKPKKLKGEKNE